MTTANHNCELHHSYNVLCRRNSTSPKKQRFTPLTKPHCATITISSTKLKSSKPPGSLDDENTSITGAIGPQYYVHYKGWQEKWNEWVPAERLLKKNPENLRLQASLKALVPLLRVPTVFDILISFSDSILSTKSPHLIEPNLVLPTIISGLQCCFDCACGPNLIYANERAQFAEVRKQYWAGPKVIVGREKEMGLVYGAEHLLRMLVVFPMTITNAELDDGSVQMLRDSIDELLLYMEHERENIFL